MGRAWRKKGPDIRPKLIISQARPKRDSEGERELADVPASILHCASNLTYCAWRKPSKQDDENHMAYKRLQDLGDGLLKTRLDALHGLNLRS